MTTLLIIHFSIGFCLGLIPFCTGLVKFLTPVEKNDERNGARLMLLSPFVTIAWELVLLIMLAVAIPKLWATAELGKSNDDEEEYR